MCDDDFGTPRATSVGSHQHGEAGGKDEKSQFPDDIHPIGPSVAISPLVSMQTPRAICLIHKDRQHSPLPSDLGRDGGSIRMWLLFRPMSFRLLALRRFLLLHKNPSVEPMTRALGSWNVLGSWKVQCGMFKVESGKWKVERRRPVIWVPRISSLGIRSMNRYALIQAVTGLFPQLLVPTPGF